VPERDARTLWEKLILDGFQAGLAWITILRKREGFRTAFEGFDPEVIARYGEADIARLMADPGIVRARLKIEGSVKNARAYLAMRDRGEGFSDFLWAFVDGAPVQNRWRALREIPAQTPVSVEMSKALKARGFTFVGPVIVYAFMQATGLVNDHVVDCHRWDDVRQLGESL